jgi:N utilization substance protein B
MLNRRILRVKAMQALYSFFTAQESLKSVVRERLESQYYPDPAKDDFTESGQFTKRRKQASELFKDHLIDRKVPLAEGSDPEIVDAAQNAISSYHTEVISEKKTIRKAMIADIESIRKLYIKLLSLPLELAELDRREKAKKENAHIQKASSWKWNFLKNTLIDDLTKNEAFNTAIIDLKVSWTAEMDQVKYWYKEIFKKDETIVAYQFLDNPTEEEHHQILIYIFKKVIFKNESIDEFFDESDLRWSENKSILKSLLVKTFQDYSKDLDPAYELKEVIKNSEDDLEFFEQLFDETLKKNDFLNEIIEKKVQNWDYSRVALTDAIILKMALTEMMHFHSIPIKVSINEFIEISKEYSTPKSKQFINGILDVLVNELTSEGVIKKSGRGLIDNK